jgi:hypothetical protein
VSFVALLAALAHKEGRAQTTALFRHRAITKDPLAIVAWQLGGEPYSVGAIALGRQHTGFQIFVPGYPLNRDLLFYALAQFGHEFCAQFEAVMAGPTEVLEEGNRTLEIPVHLPQILVPSIQTIDLIGRLGRRLAYLNTDAREGKAPADPILVRLGRHLQWIARYAQMPGQQLILPLSELLATHYATSMSRFEAQSLPALNAWIDPPPGIHGFDAASEAERLAVGPVPNPLDGDYIYTHLMKPFNERRGKSTNPALIEKLVKPIRDYYADMTTKTWDLVWQVIQRERKKPEAESVERRVLNDRKAYGEHMAWMNGPQKGLRRSRMTHRGAAELLNTFERELTLMEAEEAIDDPLRMAPHILSGKAMAGVVIVRDVNRRELIGNRACLRPSVTVRTNEPCFFPPDTELWWTKGAKGREWKVVGLEPDGASTKVTLILQTNIFKSSPIPDLGQRVCFSEFNKHKPYEMFLPSAAPWPHKQPKPPSDGDIEHTDLGVAG